MKCLLALAVVQALYFTLPGNSKRCISETLQVGDVLSGDYLISGVAEQLVLTRLFSPNGEIAHKNLIGKPEGHFDLTAQSDGEYKLCFQAFDRAQKSVSFHLGKVEKKEELASEKDIDPLEDSIGEMSVRVDRILRNVKFFQRREKVHRDLTEKTCENVVWSALAKIVVLVCVAVAEVTILLRGFQKGSSKV